MMITSHLWLLSLFLTISFRVMGDFVLHRAFRRGFCPRGILSGGIMSGGILSGYRRRRSSRLVATCVGIGVSPNYFNRTEFQWIKVRGYKPSGACTPAAFFSISHTSNDSGCRTLLSQSECGICTYVAKAPVRWLICTGIKTEARQNATKFRSEGTRVCVLTGIRRDGIAFWAGLFFRYELKVTSCLSLSNYNHDCAVIDTYM